MASIAIIGGDGAGKTTITKMLLEDQILPFRYLYMGVNVGSSNVALPTSRLALWVKRKLAAQKNHDQSATVSHPEASVSRDPSQPRSKSKLRNALRLVNRIAEEIYRQFLSWGYELRGYVPLYDRHFSFDFYREAPPAGDDRLSDRLHAWFVCDIYPKPTLVILLDAPSEVLMARKGEATIEYLDARRAAFLDLGATLPHFVRIDATKPLDDVYTEVKTQIERFWRNRSS